MKLSIRNKLVAFFACALLVLAPIGILTTNSVQVKAAATGEGQAWLDTYWDDKNADTTELLKVATLKDGDIAADAESWIAIDAMKTAYEKLSGDDKKVADANAEAITAYKAIMDVYEKPIVMKQKIAAVAKLVVNNDVAYADKAAIDLAEEAFTDGKIYYDNTIANAKESIVASAASNASIDVPAAFYTAFSPKYEGQLDKAVELYGVALENINNAKIAIDNIISAAPVTLADEASIVAAYALVEKDELVKDATARNYVVKNFDNADTKYVNERDYATLNADVARTTALDNAVEDLKAIFTKVNKVADDIDALYAEVKIIYQEDLADEFSKLYYDGDTATWLAAFDGAKYIKNVVNGEAVKSLEAKINAVNEAYLALDNADTGVLTLTEKGIVDAVKVSVEYANGENTTANGDVYTKDKLAAVLAVLANADVEINAVIAKIGEIGEVVYTTESLNKIIAAEDLVTVKADGNKCVLDLDVLATFADEATQDKYVTNYSTLLAARAKYDALKKEVEEVEALIEVANDIHIEITTGEFDTAYLAAKTKYDALKDVNQKLNLKNVDTWDILTAYYTQLEIDIKDFRDRVDAVAVNPSDACREALNKLNNEYNSFPADYKSAAQMVYPKTTLDAKNKDFADQTSVIQKWLDAVQAIADDKANCTAATHAAANCQDSGHEINGTNTPKVNFANWDLVTTATTEYALLENVKYLDTDDSWQFKLNEFFPKVVTYYNVAVAGRTNLEAIVKGVADDMFELSVNFNDDAAANTYIAIGSSQYDIDVTAVTTAYKALGTNDGTGEVGQAAAEAFLIKTHNASYLNYTTALKYQAAVVVEAKIAAIPVDAEGKANVTLADNATVVAAREAYDAYIAALKSDEKDIVRNKTILTDAETILAAITKDLNDWIDKVIVIFDEEGDHKTAYTWGVTEEGKKDAQALILKLEGVNLVDEDDTTDDIAALIAAYEALILTDDTTDDPKATDANKIAFLTNGKKYIDAIKQQGIDFANKVKTDIAALNDSSDFEAINGAYTNYGKLLGVVENAETQLGIVGDKSNLDKYYVKVQSATAIVEAINKVVEEVAGKNYSYDNWALALALKGSYYGFASDFIVQANAEGEDAIKDLEAVLAEYEALSADKVLSLAGLADQIAKLDNGYATDAELNAAKTALLNTITTSINGASETLQGQINNLIAADETINGKLTTIGQEITAIIENTIPQAKQQAIADAKAYVDAEIAKIQTKIDSLEGENAELKDALNAANEAIKAAQGTATAGLIIGIIALLAAAGLYVIKYALKK